LKSRKSATVDISLCHCSWFFT